MQIFFASQNKGKITEVRSILSDLGFDLKTVADFPDLKNFDVEETGKTFAENALLKAQTFAEKTNLLTLADDSGLAVEALNGEPGVKSARWVPGSNHDRNVALLNKMQGKENRKAKFVTVLCLYDPITKHSEFFDGEINGYISQAILGEDGFGYDPVFLVDEYGKTFAQLGADLKNQISHRKKALEELKEWLKEKK